MIDDAEGGGTSNITGTYSQVVSQLRSKNATDQDLRDLAAAYRRKVFAESGKADSNTGAVTSQHKNSLSDLTDAGDKKKFDPVKVARFLDFEPDDPATDVAVKMFMDSNRGDLKDDEVCLDRSTRRPV